MKKSSRIVPFLSFTSDRNLFLFFFTVRVVILLGVLLFHWIGTIGPFFPRYGFFSSVRGMENATGVGGEGGGSEAIVTTVYQKERLSVFTVDYSPLLLEKDDNRLSVLKVWDGVHFHHIQLHGYTHENSVVFFPLVPYLIRGMRLLMTSDYTILKIFHFLVYLAPVCFYVSLLNCVLSAAAAVLTRKLLLLTCLGPEAAYASRFNLFSVLQKGDSPTSSDLSNIVHNLQTVIKARQSCGAFGSVLDADLPTFLSDEDSVSFPTLETEPRLFSLYRYRVVGCALFYLLITPATVFYIVNYTEPLYSFLIVAGVWARAYYRPVVDIEREKVPAEGVEYIRSPFLSSSERKGKGLRFEEKWMTVGEVLSTAIFFFASAVRSNAILSVGFILYPLFIQIAFPRVYEKRWRMIHAGLGVGGDVDDTTTTTVVRTVYMPTRFPSLSRLLVGLLQAVLLCVPYVAVSLTACRAFTPDLEPKKSFSECTKMYGYIQRKYWNVGFLRSYSIQKLDVLFVAGVALVPMMIAFYRFYIQPSFSNRHQWHRKPSRWSWVERLVSSSSAVYFLVHLLLSAFVVHLQVSFRFSSTCPFLCFFYGAALAQVWGRKPSSRRTSPPSSLLARLTRNIFSRGLASFVVFSALAAGLFNLVTFTSFAGVN